MALPSSRSELKEFSVGWRFYGNENFVRFKVKARQQQDALSALIRKEFNGELPHNVQLSCSEVGTAS
ncbi:hypothetical protein [Neptuniibacter sp. QD37_11]|uniref:hypothetical protein n=1 Tax=Neptuniibacter sp. QD37_11 TaxID=3398209 RepID=UPI0039F54328